MTFHHKNRVQKHNFSVEVLSELSNQASQVLTSMQVALGFVMAFNTALLALLVNIGQTINSNCAIELGRAVKITDACKALLCIPNIIPWAACTVFAYIGGRTNLAALEMHMHMNEHYSKLVSNYNGIAKSSLADGQLPDISVCLKQDLVERIYYIAAYWFFFLCALFLTCFFTSSVYFQVIKDGHIYAWVTNFFIISLAFCALTFFRFYKRTGYTFQFRKKT